MLILPSQFFITILLSSINRNLENVSILLDELDFHFNVIGITITKTRMPHRRELVVKSKFTTVLPHVQGLSKPPLARTTRHSHNTPFTISGTKGHRRPK